MGILQTYYTDWDAAMEYVYEEHTHPLENTYWKTRACISIRDEEKEAYQLDASYSHHARSATMEDGIEDVAAEACMGLRGHHFEDRKEEQYRFLPHQHLELEWAMMDSQGTDPTTQVMVHFCRELVGKIRRLEDQLKAQQETLKRYQQEIDDQRVSLRLPRIYEKVPHKPCP